MKLSLPILALVCLHAASAREYILVVKGGPTPAQGVIAKASVPADFPAQGKLSGHALEVPFQQLEPGRIVFQLDKLEANQEIRFAVKESAPAAEAVAARQTDGRIDLTIQGKPVFSYQGRETSLPRENIKPAFKRGGYLHPVLTPAGKQVTDDYPSNHIHHHGIWFPWTKTEFEGRAPDFWNMGDQKGKVEFTALKTSWSGPVHGGFVAQHRFIDLTSGSPKPVLDETWRVTAYANPKNSKPAWIFDLASTQQCATASRLFLPKYHYGGLGFRGNWAWNGTNQTFFLTSNGETDRLKGNETRGNWCYIGGQVDGARAGLVVMCHPDNFRAPQPMRLHPSEPFFCFAPSQLGDWSIEPGQPYLSQYRFVVIDGEPNPAEIDRLWKSYEAGEKVIVKIE